MKDDGNAVIPVVHSQGKTEQTSELGPQTVRRSRETRAEHDEPGYVLKAHLRTDGGVPLHEVAVLSQT